MSSSHRRKRIAHEAARILCYREESSYHRARWKAAIRVSSEGGARGSLPVQREIQEEVHRLQQSLDHDQWGLPPEQQSIAADAPPERFRLYQTLLLPLEQVKEDRQRHPEGDALYHSLQVFELARAELPYDEEFLLAALLHDVGKAIDRREHEAAALDALDGAVTARTAWLIEHHTEALSVQDGTLGVRSLRRLQAEESFPELMILADCDRRGRVRGATAPDVSDALDYIRGLAEELEARS